MRRLYVPALGLALIAARGWPAGVAVGAMLLNAPLSVRQAGMGGASVGGADVLRAWSNPALLSDQSTRGVLALTGSSVFDNTQTMAAGGASWLFSPGWAVGIMGADSSMSFPEIDGKGVKVGNTVGRTLQAVGIASSWKLDWLRTGFALKGAASRLDRKSASGGGADAGLAAVWGGLTVAAAARNIGIDLSPDGSPVKGSDASPMEYRGGAAYKFEAAQLTICAEEAVAAAQEQSFNGGAECWVMETLGLRTGITLLTGGIMQVTGGLSAKIRRLSLDYAMSTHLLGMTHTFSISYEFGPNAGEMNPPQ